MTGGDEPDLELIRDGARVMDLASSLGTTSRWMEVYALVIAGLSLLGGLALALYKYTDATGHSRHPFLNLGIGLMIGSVVVGIIHWSLARALRLFAAYTSVRVRTDGELMDVLESRDGS